jgi:hypothetical protein
MSDDVSEGSLEELYANLVSIVGSEHLAPGTELDAAQDPTQHEVSNRGDTDPRNPGVASAGQSDDHRDDQNQDDDARSNRRES